MALEQGAALLEGPEEVFAHDSGRILHAAPARVSPRILHAVTPISAVLIAQNEERKIQAAIESVRFCDEVVLVDAGSIDQTRAIAEQAGARVIVNAPWPGFVAQRDFAVRAARHDWVLALDADERVSPALRAEVEELRTRGFDCPGYRMARVAQHLGRWIRATDWYPDPQIRLFDRTRGGWEGALVHESVRVRGPVGVLKGELEHHPYADISDHLRKIDIYTTLWAQTVLRGRKTRRSLGDGRLQRLGLRPELCPEGRLPPRLAPASPSRP